MIIGGLYEHTTDQLFNGSGDHEEKVQNALFILDKQYDFMSTAANTMLVRAAEKVVGLSGVHSVFSACIRCVEILDALLASNAGRTSDDDSAPIAKAAAAVLRMLHRISYSGFMFPEIHAGNYL